MNVPKPTLNAVRILLVDDHTAIRNMLAQYIAALEGYAVVGEVADVAAAQQLTDELKPDVVVLDWLLAAQSGRDYLNRLPKDVPPRVLIFSGDTSELTVREALAAGAKGMIEKTASFSEFTLALKTVASGSTYYGPAITLAIQRMLRNPDRVSVKTELSPRECDVLRLVAQGLSSKEIGALLQISVRTVENHRASIFQRTGLRSIAQLTLHAVRLGLAASPDTKRVATHAPVS